ncbi:MAG: single-stranded DNA-binding protein [Lachnospiraceae bacterium]|nr:single-stranded DNA-binding protein [Lachnospiraceae bacterium]
MMTVSSLQEVRKRNRQPSHKIGGVCFLLLFQKGMKSMSINALYLEGRLTRDPELRRTQSGIEVATSSLAVLKPNGTDTDFLDLVAWREMAKFFSTYRKGQRVLIEGELTTRSWTDRDGRARRNVEIIVHTIRGLAVRNKEDESSNEPAEQTPAYPHQPQIPEPAVPAAPADPDYAIPD